MLQVGINENVVLSGAEVTTADDKLSLILTFRDKGDVNSGDDPYAQLAGDGMVSRGKGSGIRIFPPLPPLPQTKAGENKTSADMSTEAIDAISERKNTLIQILSCYTTADKIQFSVFAGMDDVITRETLNENIIKPEVLKACFKNMAEQFVAQVTPFLDKDENAVRLLLVRQSKEKHYAQIRERFVKDNPFIESAVIPKAQSKLKFTKFEMDRGLNDGTPIAQAQADTADDTVSQADIDSIFGEHKSE